MMEKVILGAIEMREALDCSGPTLNRYCQQGLVVKAGHNKYDLLQSVPRILKNLRTQAGSSDLEGARIQNLDANTRKTLLEIARKEGELIDDVRNQEVQRQTVFQFGVFLHNLPDALVRSNICAEKDVLRLVDFLNAERVRLVQQLDGGADVR
jgi:hypothetical protein